jgi:ribonucleoside-diphosphate reductase alpha chain
VFYYNQGKKPVWWLKTVVQSKIRLFWLMCEEIKMAMHVMKRTGEVVPFEESRIHDAIMKAVRASGSSVDKEKIDVLVKEIATDVESRFVDFYPNVENVQDLVEKHLANADMFAVSKAYILYRAKRQEARDEERKHTIEKSILGKLKVKKRDGRTVLFDVARIEKTIKRLAKGYENDISVNLITKELINNIYDGVSTQDLEKALTMATAAYIEKDPAYSWVAGRAFLQRLYKEVFGSSVADEADLEKAYKNVFVENIKRGIKYDLYHESLLDYDLEKMSTGLQVKRDEELQFMGVQTLYERYFARHEDTRLETPQMFWMRVAMGLAAEEKNKEEKALEFYEVLSTLRFVSSTPTLFHSGTPRPQLSSCYLHTVGDDLGNIFKSFGDHAQLSKWSGGLGVDYTNIRGTGAWISTTKVESQGVIPFLKIANDVTAAINRSGKRRGAACAYLESWHYDVESFLDLRKNTGDERLRTHDMNTANWIPDLFMKRVINNEDWTLFSPDETPELHHIYGKAFEEKYAAYEAKAKAGEIRKFKIVSATKLWRKMVSMLFETGHPWFTWKDACNVRSPQDHAGVIHSSNLCTEITLNTSEDETAVCNLGSVNLSRHVVNGKLDHDLLAETVKTATRMLDNVVDINYYPTAEAKNSNLRHRPVGLGIMGLQDALFKLDMGFEQDNAMEFSDNVMEEISYHAILTSSKLAKERGVYGSYKGSKWDRGMLPIDTLDLLEKERGMEIPVPRGTKLDWTPVRQSIKEYGMRNSNLMAIAPTATISTISGCFPCIEPIYKNIYVKANMSGEFTVVNPYLVDDLKKLNMWNDEMLDQLKYYDGNVSLIAGMPDHLKEKYKESFQVDPKALIMHTARRQKWIDQSQSHNVFIKGTNGRYISDVYQFAWMMGLKTTYYLRTLAATQIEKSTLDAKKYGFTQNREYASQEGETTSKEDEQAPFVVEEKKQEETKMNPPVKLCRLEDPDCEACQ